MATSKRWFWLGSDPGQRDAVAACLGGAPPVGLPATQAVAGDVIVIAAGASGDVLPTGHAFGAARAFKEAGQRVFLLIAEGDRVGLQLARFCLIDGVLFWNAAKQSLVADELVATPQPKRVAVDALLARLEPHLAGSRGESSLQRLLRFERDDSLSSRLQDPETGLFDGPYATLKLDEEWKRAHRFHQPLSLLLIDLCLGPALAEADRRQVLAEAAGVFLNECRDIDVLARFSPSVFLFLLPGTGPDGAEVLSRRILTSLRERLAAVPVAPACGLCSVPSAEVPDRRAFLAIAEACLGRAIKAGGGVCSTWQ